MEKIMEIPGGRGSNAKPSGTENPVGWRIKLEKTLRGGSMDIFWNHTLQIIIILIIIIVISSKRKEEVPNERLSKVRNREYNEQ